MGIPKKRNWQNLEAEFNYCMTCPEMVDTRDHLPYLRQIARGRVLEIGTDIGNSTTALLLGVQENGGQLISVDIRPECGVVYDGHPQWKFYGADLGRNLQLVEELGEFDVVYVDGDHSYAGVQRDLAVARRVLNSGGVILMHDVLALEPPNAFPDVRRAFDEVQGAMYKSIREGSYGLGVLQF